VYLYIEEVITSNECCDPGSLAFCVFAQAKGKEKTSAPVKRV